MSKVFTLIYVLDRKIRNCLIEVINIVFLIQVKGALAENRLAVKTALIVLKSRFVKH